MKNYNCEEFASARLARQLQQGQQTQRVSVKRRAVGEMDATTYVPEVVPEEEAEEEDGARFDDELQFSRFSCRGFQRVGERAGCDCRRTPPLCS